MSDNYDKQINIYVRAREYDEIRKLSVQTGMSMSKIMWMAFNEGYPKIRKLLLPLKRKETIVHVDTK
jgi:hypothetical protein